MEKGKKYVSKFKGESYDVLVTPDEEMKKYQFTIHSGKNYIGGIKSWVNSVDEALKQASQLILTNYKKQKTSSVDGQPDNKESGTIKLAWIDESKSDSILHSQTYNSLAEALKNVTKDKKTWFIFKLVSGNKNESTWELLPHGSYQTYRRGVHVTTNFLVKTSVIILSTLGAYFLITKIATKLKT